MKKTETIWLVLLALALLVAPSAHAVENKPAAGKTNAVAGATNAAPIELPIPLSSFNLTNQPIKDPFFPLSLRSPLPAPTNSQPVVISMSSFQLKGVYIGGNQKLATINNKVVEEGGHVELTVSGMKVTIYCLQIKAESAIVRIGKEGVPFELLTLTAIKSRKALH